MEDKTDEELVVLTQQNDIQAFEVLVNRYESKLIRYGYRFVQEVEPIEDAVQKVFLNTYSNIQSFNPKRKFSSWIYRIAHNEFVDIIRVKCREPYKRFDMDMIMAVADEGDILAELDRKELCCKLDAFLKELKPKYRDPIVLYYYEDKDYQEISDILQIPVSTVGIRLRRARQQLKKYYEM